MAPSGKRRPEPCPECGGPTVLDGKFCRECGWDEALDRTEDSYLDGVDIPRGYAEEEEEEEAPPARKASPLWWIVVLLALIGLFSMRSLW